MPTTTREGDGGLGHTALPRQFSPEPPSGGVNRTDEEGKERTGAGPREPIRFRRNTEGGLGGPVLTPPVGLLPTPAPEPRSLLWSLFVAPAHLQEEPASARPLAGPECCPARRSCSSLQFLRHRRELAATASRYGGAKTRRQPPSLCSRAGKAGSAARPAPKRP